MSSRYRVLDVPTFPSRFSDFCFLQDRPNQYAYLIPIDNYSFAQGIEVKILFNILDTIQYL